MFSFLIFTTTQLEDTLGILEMVESNNLEKYNKTVKKIDHHNTKKEK